VKSALQRSGSDDRTHAHVPLREDEIRRAAMDIKKVLRNTLYFRWWFSCAGYTGLHRFVFLDAAW